MKNVKEYLDKAYAAAMYEGLHETADLIELAIESLCRAAEEELEKNSSGQSDATDNFQKNVVVFPIEYIK